MFLNYLKEDKLVADFQVVYETDNKLLLDFYSCSSAREGEAADIEIECELPAYGMVVLRREDNEALEARYEQIAHDRTALENKSEAMVSAIIALDDENRRFERAVQGGSFDKNALRALFERVTDAMKYRRLADTATELLTERVSNERLGELHVPSYIELLSENLRRAGSLREAESFIWEYGYLGSFDIAPCRFESTEFLLSHGGEGEVKALEVSPDTSACSSPDERLLYILSWYSELRHIQQLRALRNFRLYLEHEGMDIHETDIKVLFGDA